MIDEEHRTLKCKLLGLREGEALVVSTKGLANFRNGSTITIPSGARDANSYHRLAKTEKCRALIMAHKELTLALRFPPDGVYAEEMPGQEFRVRFIRMENGHGRGGRA
jgi:hypothetical protein